ncbi:carbohydrate-binding protein [Streptomyces hainanensis]|uniref:Carbohydrate-binding protein n=1 Tax=Streptomyces hainanensis TaxID=402648 RepID=A0A4R4TAZ8_9ACTN|nr:carbohydrate-binding protein [Streptomyces hainanensis]TDC74491.1 carbohydrate-binding protein [Streptomyces hainanensis]
MSAGNTGGGTPGEGDDPFAYLYRPEDGQPQAPSGPRQPSYNQVRPVGQRTFGGQQGQQGGGYGYPPQQHPDARYAAPETRPQGMPPGGHGGHGRRQAPEPRRNGLLIGAIAVVLAVVIGVGAAIVFSGGEDDNQADGQETTAPTDDSENGGDDGGDDEPSEAPTGDTADGGLPAAEMSDLQLSGISVASGLEGARSSDGSYVAVQNAQNSTITWSFEYDGEPGTYRVNIGYSVASDGQTMAMSFNSTPREDPVEMLNYGATQLGEGWYSTWKQVELTAGTNTVQLTCAGSCDVLVDSLTVGENE